MEESYTIVLVFEMNWNWITAQIPYFWIWCFQHLNGTPCKDLIPWKRKRPLSALQRRYGEINASKRNLEKQNWFIETKYAVRSCFYFIAFFLLSWIIFDITFFWWKCKYPRKNRFFNDQQEKLFQKRWGSLNFQAHRIFYYMWIFY